MRKIYNPASEKTWTGFYTKQAQIGGGFVGMPYQRGAGIGSIFRGLFRALLPALTSVGKTVGKQALTTGAQIASDIVAGESIKEAAKNRSRQGAAKLFQAAADNLQQGGRKRKRVAKSKPKKRTKLTDQLGFYLK